MDVLSGLRAHYAGRRLGWQLLDHAGNLRERVAYRRAVAGGRARREDRAYLPTAPHRTRDASLGADLLRAALDVRPRVLVCDWTVPMPDRDSGSQRMDWMLRLLSPMCSRITLIPSRRYAYHDNQLALQRCGIEVVVGDHRRLSRLLEPRAGMYDLVILSRSHVAERHISTIRRLQPQALIVFDTVELKSERLEQQLRNTGVARDGSASRERALEDALISASDLVATVSEEESLAVKRRFPTAPTIVLPNVHGVADLPVASFASRRDLIFIGNFTHPPNVDAVRWFGLRVMPLIRREIDAVLRVVGPGATPKMVAGWGQWVRYEGWVPDVVSLCDEARVAVAPLRYGAGVKGKIGQALSLGLPVVTTSPGAAGMDLVDGTHVLIGDEPQAFADAVVQVYRDESVWNRLSQAGVMIAAERWSPDTMRARLAGLVQFAIDRESAVDQTVSWHAEPKRERVALSEIHR